MHLRTFARRSTGTLVAAALVSMLAGTLGALPAHAADGLDPANRLGDLILTPVSGGLVSNGDPSSVTTVTGCPEGFRGSSRAVFLWESGTQAALMPALAQASVVAGNGLDGLPMNRTGNAAARWITAGFPLTQFQSGLATYIITCEPGDAPDGTYPAEGTPISATTRYFSIPIRIDTTAKTWAVETTAVVKTTPVITFDGATANADGSVTLTATVTGDSGPATSGTVELTGTYPGQGAPVTASVPVSAGAATWTTPVLDAGKEYTFTAAYKANGNAAYDDTTTDATALVTTVAEPVQPQQTDLTVTIPAAATGLKFTVTEGDVTFGQATLDGSTYIATGTLGAVTVSDNRPTRTTWSLQGQAGDFTQAADPTKKITADNLGWKPALVGAGTTNGGTAGGEVPAGTGTGLGAAQPLAQAAAGATAVDTTVNADLTLKAPADSAAGDYTATLTLTLI